MHKPKQLGYFSVISLPVARARSFIWLAAPTPSHPRSWTTSADDCSDLCDGSIRAGRRGLAATFLWMDALVAHFSINKTAPGRIDPVDLLRRGWLSSMKVGVAPPPPGPVRVLPTSPLRASFQDGRHTDLLIRPVSLLLFDYLLRALPPMQSINGGPRWAWLSIKTSTTDFVWAVAQGRPIFRKWWFGPVAIHSIPEPGKRGPIAIAKCFSLWTRSYNDIHSLYVKLIIQI